MKSCSRARPCCFTVRRHWTLEVSCNTGAPFLPPANGTLGLTPQTLFDWGKSLRSEGDVAGTLSPLSRGRPFGVPARHASRAQLTVRRMRRGWFLSRVAAQERRGRLLEREGYGC